MPASSPERARLPADVPLSGLLDLSRQGEVALLPVHDQQPFNALIVTKSRESCEQVAHEMLDVETWPSRWSIKSVTVDERTATSVRYRMQLDIALAPTIPGFIEHPSPDKVIFNDVQTGAKFIWTLGDVEGGCAMRYSLLETPGKPSEFVAVMKALEGTIADAGNFAAGLSSARGFAHPETSGATASASGLAAFAALAGHGTALRIWRQQKKFPVVIARRVIERPVDEVLWSVRDKKRYTDKIAVFKTVDDHGTNCHYKIGAFGGRVSFDTAVSESGDAHTDEGITLTEKVTGGDLKRGGWTWHVKPVAGGTDVEITFDLDITEGSTVMSTLASADPVAKESMTIHMALALMGDLIGGKPLGERTLARAP
ncbi:MAG TPA: SRPBCC family protein [Myxococcota bacterium]